MGIVGTYFAATFSYAVIGGVYNTTNAVANFIGSLSFFLGLIVIFAWVDLTVRIARKTDPLRRDTFRWKRVRTIVWAMLVIVPSSVFGLSLPLLASNQSPSGILLLPALVTIVAIMLTTGPAPLLSGSRSKDSTLRTHPKWFGCSYSPCLRLLWEDSHSILCMRM
ncbi:MAG TPA: hypothetical protein VNA15_09495 [Candidatus Angelobacter sp.]|nr:hypothetical protein [Candidatus Angelobacter sp.]